MEVVDDKILVKKKRRTIKQLFKQIDINGMPVVLNMDGQEKVVTTFGAFVTLFIYAIILAYFT